MRVSIRYRVTVRGFNFERPESLGEEEFNRRVQVNKDAKDEVRTLVLTFDPHATFTDMESEDEPIRFFVNTTPDVASVISSHPEVESVDEV